MMKRKRLLLFLLVLILGGYFAYNYIYKEHRDIKTETSKMETSAKDLVAMFKANDATSVLNSTITVSGVITEIEPNSITLDNSVYCNFSESKLNFTENEHVVIKGRCIGYDDLFELVKLDQCTLIK